MKFVHVLLAVLLASAMPASSEPFKEVPSEDRDAQPFLPPTPVYPIAAAYFGVSGRCDVRFNVDAYGYTKEIRPFCSHAVFCKSARDAVGTARFEPKTIHGRAVPRRNVVYPLWYYATESTDELDATLAAMEIQSCSSDPIS